MSGSGDTPGTYTSPLIGNNWGEGYSQTKMTLGAVAGPNTSTLMGATGTPAQTDPNNLYLRKFTQGLLSSLPDTEMVLKKFTIGMLTAPDQKGMTVRKFTIGVLSSIHPDGVALNVAAKASIQGILTNSTNFRASQKATISGTLMDASSLKDSTKGFMGGIIQGYTSIFSRSVGVIFDAVSSSLAMTQVTRAAIFGEAFRGVYAYNTTQAVLMDMQSNTCNLFQSSNATVFGAVTHAAYAHTYSQIAIFEIARSLTLFQTAETGSIFGMVRWGIYNHSQSQGVIFDITQSLVLNSAAESGVIGARLSGSAMVQGSSTSVRYDRTKSEKELLVDASLGSIYNFIPNAVQNLTSSNATLMGAMPDYSWIHTVTQAILFDQISDYALFRTAENGIVVGKNNASVGMVGMSKSTLYSRVNTEKTPLVSSTLAEIYGSTIGGIHAHYYSQIVLFDVLSDYAMLNVGQLSTTNGLFTNSVTTRGFSTAILGQKPSGRNVYIGTSVLSCVYKASAAMVNILTLSQSIIFEYINSIPYLVESALGNILSKQPNLVNTVGVSKGVLYLSNRAYGRRRVTYLT